MPNPQEAPNVSLGNSQAVGFATRTGLQLVTGGFIVEGIELFSIYNFTEAQAKWAAGALTVLLAFTQNFFEQRRNRRFIGPAPTPEVLPEDGPGEFVDGP